MSGGLCASEQGVRNDSGGAVGGANEKDKLHARRVVTGLSPRCVCRGGWRDLTEAGDEPCV